MSVIGEQIKKYRVERGITQEQAMEIGRQEFLRLLKEQGVEYTQDWLNSFRPGVSSRRTRRTATPSTSAGRSRSDCSATPPCWRIL